MIEAGRFSLEPLGRDAFVDEIYLDVGRHNAAAVDRRVGFEGHDRHLMTKWLVDPPGPPAAD